MADDLDTLHTALTRAMLRELQFAEDNELPVPAADKAAVAKFLKDNNVVKTPQDTDELEALRQRLADQNKARRDKATAGALELAKEDVTGLYQEH